MNRILLPLALITTIACGGVADPTDSPLAAPQPTEVLAAPVEVTHVEPILDEVPIPLGIDDTVDRLSDDATLASSSASMEPVEPVEPPPARYELRRGETLAHYARWSGQPVEDVAASSHLDLDGTYAVGTEVALQLTDEERSVVEARRDAHHQLRARNYLSSRGSTRTEFYAVRTGDNAWRIAQDQLGMPVWLLESLNPSTDLDTLRPGQELLVPVFQDIVVEAESEMPEVSDRIEPSLQPE